MSASVGLALGLTKSNRFPHRRISLQSVIRQRSRQGFPMVEYCVLRSSGKEMNHIRVIAKCHDTSISYGLWKQVLGPEKSTAFYRPGLDPVTRQAMDEYNTRWIYSSDKVGDS